MSTLSPLPLREDVLPPAEPTPRWRRLVPRSRRGKTAVAGGVSVLLVASLLGASYETSPGGTLWGVEKTIFPAHAQDVALTAVVNDLKNAQDILGSGQQPTPDQLTQARTYLNQAKQDLDYLSPSPQRTNLQNLYLQLTQQLLQYTPDSAQQLPPLPAPPAAPQAAADPGSLPQSADVALTAASAPTWGYPITDQSGSVAPDDYGPPPLGVPDAPAADWPQPYAPPLTPNLQDLGYYDPSWGPLYGYDPTDWYNYNLGGYNQYGYDFLGFDRWGYDRWGYDRWGYDRWGYNWAGYNWGGYDRDGWDRDGCNEWGQHRGHPGDPRDVDWYNRHHPYAQYYQWRFRHDDPVYHRTQWDQEHGFNPYLYQNWNMNRDWHNPRNRDWAPTAPVINAVNSVTNVNIHASAPVVNLNASLTQFISNDKVTTTSGTLMKDLANKSARDFTKELSPRINTSVTSLPPSTAEKLFATPNSNRQTPFAPPALTAPAPTAPPSKVAPGFTAPKVAPVPALTPPAVKSQAKPGPTANPPEGVPGALPDNPAPHQAVPVPQGPVSEAPVPDAPAHPVAPVPQEPQQQQAAPEPPAQHDAPVPQWQAPTPAPEAPVQQKPVQQAPVTEAPAEHKPVQQPPVPEAPAEQKPVQQAPVEEAPAPQRPVRQAPPVREAPVEQAPPVHQAPPVYEAPPVHEAPPPRPAPEPRQAPAQRAPAPACTPPFCTR
ncbi:MULTISPECIES: hypothetical protein [unclassified Mycolicibacterium]|uniref:hypothetical protein n=1 Tax=unclassified Mycolicibacterium TaxID=2636767 RepID=UPI002ED86E9F